MKHEIIMKKILLLLLIVSTLLIGCSKNGNTNLLQNNSATVESEEMGGKTYPPENGINLEKDCPSVPEEIFSTTAEENNLAGTIYKIEGLVEDYVSTGNTNAMVVNTSVNESIIIIDPVSTVQNSEPSNEIDVEQMRTYYPLPEVGETIIIYAEYQGMSDVYEAPAFLYATEDYLSSALLLCSKGAAQENDVTLEEANVPEEKGTVENPYEEGMYKVGVDVPAGEYVFLQCTPYEAYVCASSDSNQDDIIANEIFENSYFMTVEEGQYLEAANCEFFQAEEYTLVTSQDGVLRDGMYRVGIDIDAGEYKVEATQEEGGYWCIYNNSKIPQEIDSNKFFENSTYMTLRDGQYVFLGSCSAIKID